MTAAEPAEAELVALADPQRDMGGFQGLVHDAGQVIADCVQVDRVTPSAALPTSLASFAGSG